MSKWTRYISYPLDVFVCLSYSLFLSFFLSLSLSVSICFFQSFSSSLSLRLFLSLSPPELLESGKRLDQFALVIDLVVNILPFLLSVFIVSFHLHFPSLTLSVFLSLSLFLSLSHSIFLYLSLFLSISISIFSPFLSLSLTHSFFLYLSLFLCLALSFTHTITRSLSLSLSLSFTHTITRSLSLSHSPPLSVPRYLSIFFSIPARFSLLSSHSVAPISSLSVPLKFRI